MCFSNIKPGISLITYPNQQQPIKKKKSNYVKEMTEGQDSLREGMNLQEWIKYRDLKKLDQDKWTPVRLL